MPACHSTGLPEGAQNPDLQKQKQRTESTSFTRWMHIRSFSPDPDIYEGLSGAESTDTVLSKSMILCGGMGCTYKHVCKSTTPAERPPLHKSMISALAV